MATATSVFGGLRARFGQRTEKSAQPLQIRNKFYKDLREFTAWEPWGERLDHQDGNNGYIGITGMFVKQFNYSAELQKLINHGWKSSSPNRPATPSLTPRSVTIGTGRGGQETPCTLRAGFKRPAGMLNAWDHMQMFEQVGAYAFRGDRRTPDQIRAVRGFQPPSARTDSSYMTSIAKEFVGYLKRRALPGVSIPTEEDMAGYLINQVSPADRGLLAEYHFWRKVLSNEQMHLQGMTNDSFLKGYVSTTRDVGKAREAADGSLGGAHGKPRNLDWDEECRITTLGHWVYALRVESGFLIKAGKGGITKHEAEIAHLGPLEWKEVYGFAGTGALGESTVYIRNMFQQQDYKAFCQVLAQLSSVVGKVPEGYRLVNGAVIPIS
ncbi:hypothetical protein [Paludibaculum fermentans]|uniref:hypothetical protein n=1 Tax=Paludibaculum fermentans TaxID=1473598 RepID=UPI003EBB12C9